MGAFFRFGACLGVTRAPAGGSLGYPHVAWLSAALFPSTGVDFPVLACAISVGRSIGTVWMPS